MILEYTVSRTRANDRSKAPSRKYGPKAPLRYKRAIVHHRQVMAKARKSSVQVAQQERFLRR
jgi:hypothetical protein